jgi:hypothetical protein
VDTFAARSHNAELLDMHTYGVEVYRDGRWFMIRIPELDGTQ